MIKNIFKNEDGSSINKNTNLPKDSRLRLPDHINFEKNPEDELYQSFDSKIYVENEKIEL